jgi:hypothetical protein
MKERLNRKARRGNPTALFIYPFSCIVDNMRNGSYRPAGPQARGGKHVSFSGGVLMRDSLQLPVQAIGFALCAWIVWHLLGQEGLSAFSMIALLVLLLDNARLRRKLRDTEKH